MKIVVVIAIALFALLSSGCVTINNFPNQQAPQYILQEPEGSQHIRLKL